MHLNLGTTPIGGARRSAVLLFAVVVVCGALMAIPVAASQSTPDATPEGGGATTVAAGLVNPRGFTFDADGSILVALGGRGDLTAQVARIGPDGCPQIVLDGYPTARVAFGAIAGFADVAVLDGETYALLAGGDIDRDFAVNGLYRLESGGEATLLADLSSFIRDNPVAEIPGDYDTDGQPYDLLPLEDGTGFWVSEGNSNQLFRVGLDGTISRVADLSAGHPIPTGLAPGPDGSVYVALFTAAPYAEGSAKVVLVTPDGDVSDIWTGLTMPTALAIGPDGFLYATEMATGHGEDPDLIGPGTGRIVRQTGPDSLEPVATGLTFPAAMTVGADDAIYVASPAFGADDGTGAIMRVVPTEGSPVNMGVVDTGPGC